MITRSAQGSGRCGGVVLAMDTVLADAAYEAEHPRQLCRDTVGIRQSIVALNPRSTGRRWPRTPYRRALRQHFPLATDHQRWHAESGALDAEQAELRRRAVAR